MRNYWAVACQLEHSTPQHATALLAALFLAVATQHLLASISSASKTAAQHPTSNFKTEVLNTTISMHPTKATHQLSSLLQQLLLVSQLLQQQLQPPLLCCQLFVGLNHLGKACVHNTCIDGRHRRSKDKRDAERQRQQDRCRHDANTFRQEDQRVRRGAGEPQLDPTWSSCEQVPSHFKRAQPTFRQHRQPHIAQPPSRFDTTTTTTSSSGAIRHSHRKRLACAPATRKHNRTRQHRGQDCSPCSCSRCATAAKAACSTVTAATAAAVGAAAAAEATK